MPKKPRKKCFSCGKETPRPNSKYCNNKCQHEFQYQSYIKKWKNGEVRGLSISGLVSSYIKKYLRRKFKNRCCLCGWSEINQNTGLVPLVADHIDGNWQNNIERNLRLICPNCDSLTSTYAALNKGNGRKNRAPSKRAQEGRLLIGR
ncbi:HNH endonuclease [Patescibacteria group bacterium]|nr:HNH endonuclease [Patescibacteria group bacterium]MBU1563757.1 HNH endonuclease [Patescibacteria group bacterium]MBU2068246.1 HNH endonuclease [Patescibacteria group bacterium]